DVQLLVRLRPQDVGLGARAVVEHRAGVDPALAGRVQAVDVVVLRRVVVEAAPPRAVVPPQLALGLLARRRRETRGAEREVADAGSAGRARDLAAGEPAGRLIVEP